MMVEVVSVVDASPPGFGDNTDGNSRAFIFREAVTTGSHLT